MVTAYLKFCGGCNPRYDRGAVAAELKRRFAGRVEFFAHDPAIPRDIGIVIQGCENDCVRMDTLAQARKVIVLRAESDVADAVSAMEQCILGD